MGGIVIQDIEAKDADAGINALVEYKVVPINAQKMRSGSTNASLFNTTTTTTTAAATDSISDGFGMFEFPAAHIPVLTLRQSVDYESVRRYFVTIVASVSVLFYKICQIRRRQNQFESMMWCRIELLMPRIDYRQRPLWRSTLATLKINRRPFNTLDVHWAIEASASLQLIRPL